MSRSERTRDLRRAVAIAMTAVAVAAMTAPASAADELADAKAAGLVGERTDGMLGLVAADAPAQVKQLVERVNRERRARYIEIAEKNGTTVVAVAALAGKKAIEKTLPGNYVQSSQGSWVRK